MWHTRLGPLALTATAALIVGCGGSGASSNSSGHGSGQATSARTASSSVSGASHTPTPAGKLTRAELLAQSNAICRHLNAQATSVHTTSLASVGQTAPELAGYYRVALAELRKLKASAAMSRDWKAILAGYQVIAGEILVMGKFADANDLASAARVEMNIGRIQAHRIAIAKRNGFTDCAAI